MTPQLQVGNIKIDWLTGGHFHLDGGTMFGPVPKALWKKRYDVDNNNLVELCNDPILVRTPKYNIIIDTGLGNKLAPKQQKIFRVSPPWDMATSLSHHGLSRGDIDFVILTHCDFDHAGGIVMYDDNGIEQLTWPDAVHFIQLKEWHDVEHPCRRALSTYFPENFHELKRSGLVELIDGNRTICDGVKIRYSGGHTRGHQIVEIEDNRETAVHLGDLFPTRAHTNPLWVMAYDNYPLDVIDLKEQYFSEYRQRHSWFLLYHDPIIRACRLDKNFNISLSWPADTSKIPTQTRSPHG